MGMQKIRRCKHENGLTVSASSNQDGDVIDVRGYDEATVDIVTKAMPGGITALNLRVEQADDSGMSTNLEDITGALVALNTVGANGKAVIAINLVQSTQRRYIRVKTEDYAGSGTYVVAAIVNLGNRHRDVSDADHGTLVEVGA